MKNILKFFVQGLLVLFVFVGMASHLQAATLQDMDSVLLKAPDLNHFLADPQLIEEYFQVSSEYYANNDRFPRVSYEAIIKQMRIVAKAYPEFAARAWETNLGKPFQVASIAATYGRNLQESAWDRFIQDYKEKLHAQAGEFAQLDDDQALEKLRNGIENLDTKINAHEVEIKNSPLKKSEKQALIGKFYQSFKTDSGLQKLSSYVLLKWLSSDKASEIFNSGNADLILNYLKDIKDQPKKVLSQISGIENTDSLASIVKASLPDPNALQNDEKIFPHAMIPGADGELVPAEAGSKGYWDFIPSPRRFHAFFKGIYFGECVGGSNKPDFLPSLSPERWATVLLRDTEFHFVQKDGKFQGWVQAVPITRNGSVYASVDFASFSFKQSILSRSSDGTIYSESMLSGWLKQAMLHKPAHWQGFVVSKSNAINNGGALPTVRVSPAYLLGQSYDEKTSPFAHTDPTTVKALTNIIPRVGYANNYGGSMIFDAAVPDAGTLTVLKVVDKSVYQIIKNAIDNKQTDFVKGLLARIHKSAMSDLANEILTLRSAGVLKLLAEHRYALPNEVVYYTIDPLHYLPKLISAGLSIDEMKYAQNIICHDVDTTMKFSNALLTSSLVTDPDSALKAIDYEINNPGDYYVTAMNNYLKNFIPYFAKKYPNLTIDHWVQVKSMSITIESGILALQTGIAFATNPDDLLKLFESGFQKGNDNYKKTIGQYVGTRINTFFEKTPNVKQTLKLANTYSRFWSEEQISSYYKKVVSQPDVAKDLKAFASELTDKKLAARFIMDHVHSSLPPDSEAKKDLSNLTKKALANLDLNSGWEKAYKTTVHLAHTKEDLLADMTHYSTATGEYRNAIARVIQENIPRFLEMNPSYDELDKLINKGSHFESAMVALMTAQAQKATTLAQFRHVLENRGFWTTASYASARQQILLQNAEKLKKFPEILNNPELVFGLSSDIPRSSDWLESLVGNELEAHLEKTTNATEWTELLSKHLGGGSKQYQERIRSYARANYKFFLGFNPSERQLKWYTQGFYKFYERVPLRFVKPEYRPVNKSAPRCESVFTI